MKLPSPTRVPVPIFCGLIIGLVCAGCIRGVALAESEPSAPARYDVLFTLSLEPGQDAALAEITLGEGASAVRELRFRLDPGRYEGFSGDGEVIIEPDRLTWRPPPDGGSLSYTARIDHRRKNNGYDARITDDWALFRGGDLFPPAAARTTKGARSRSRLALNLPRGWSAVTPYRDEGDYRYAVSHPERRFDRPTGWMLAGKLGVRRATIADTKVAVAAPANQGMRRMDILAMLRWTLPHVRQVFPNMDHRLTVIGANDPMWRGGLSGPASLYLHADRPLISENGTSTLLHEVMHVAMGARGTENDDWVVEGLAEYYGIEVLGRSGTVDPARTAKTLAALGRWGEDVDDLFVSSSSGSVTARATVLMAALDKELAKLSGGSRSLDDLVALIANGDGSYTYESLCRLSTRLVDKIPASLTRDRVPGAPDLVACGGQPVEKAAVPASGRDSGTR